MVGKSCMKFFTESVDALFYANFAADLTRKKEDI